MVVTTSTARAQQFSNPVADLAESRAVRTAAYEQPPESVTEPQGGFPAWKVSGGDAIATGPAPEKQNSGVGSVAAPVVTTASALAVVLAVFGCLVWITKRYGPVSGPRGGLPEDVLQNLGHAMIDGKTRVTFLRLGDRVLVLGQTASGDPHTLTEITDPEEISRVTHRCLGRPKIVGQRRRAVGSGSHERDLAIS
ncbi:FliO/MopB family protein [Roseiconus nitratireducens]|nr:flagellar biosynthetic protein FliO [Roseiconus nitratireducens]